MCVCVFSEVCVCVCVYVCVREATFQPPIKGSQDKKLNFIGVENLKDRAKSIHISS